MKITLVVDGKKHLDEEEYDSFVFASMTKENENHEVGVNTSVKANLGDARELLGLLAQKIAEAYEELTNEPEVVN